MKKILTTTPVYLPLVRAYSKSREGFKKYALKYPMAYIRLTQIITENHFLSPPTEDQTAMKEREKEVENEGGEVNEERKQSSPLLHTEFGQPEYERMATKPPSQDGSTSQLDPATAATAVGQIEHEQLQTTEGTTEGNTKRLSGGTAWDNFQRSTDIWYVHQILYSHHSLLSSL